MTNIASNAKGGAPLSLPYSLRFFLFAIFAFTIVSYGYNLVARGLGYGIPYTFAYFFVPGNFVHELAEFRERFHYCMRPEFFTMHAHFMYPPAMTLPKAAL